MQSRTASGFGFLLAVLCNAAPVSAQEGGQVEAKGFTCAFVSGTSTSYEAGNFATKPPQPLAFEIADIALEAQTARLVMNGQKAAELKIVRAINANHFLEVVNEGFLNLTTVYDEDAATGKHPAVHSRHLGVVGQPVFAQYAGFCTEK